MSKVFLTVGSQKFPFDRLLKAVDECVRLGTIKDTIVAQTGYSSYEPRCFEWKPFMDRDEFHDSLTRSSLVITHGGTGTIVSALKLGKKVLAVPRLSLYGEHVDDHQVQLLQQFSDAGLIGICLDTNNFLNAYNTVLSSDFTAYCPNNVRFVEDLERYLFSGGE